MNNAELIQAFRAEIEMRIKECEATYPKGGYWFPEQEEAYAIAEEYKQLLSFLGTLEDGASEKPNNQMEIVNDLTSEVPTRAVQLPDGRWVTEAFANNNCIYGRKPEERHCEYCSANCSTGHDFQRTKGLDEAAKNYALNTAEDSEQYSARYLGYKDGAKWQKAQDDKELSEKIAAAYQLGLADKEKQMKSEAVEGYVNYYEDSGGILMAEAQVGCPYHFGDKVRIIIVKEDEK